MSNSINEIFDTLKEELSKYIESTYHISNKKLIKQRNDLLKQKEVIFQKPFIESTPKYKQGDKFDKLENLDDAAKEILNTLIDQKILFSKPFAHQFEALKEIIINKKNAVITTGTGSGKTESFLIPIISKLAIEAKNKPSNFKNYNAVRSLILYPMNALVNDQLGRVRNFFGNSEIVNTVYNWSGRPIRFARYTSRTLYPGRRTKDKDINKMPSFSKFYIQGLIDKIDDEDEKTATNAKEIINILKKTGKWPKKENLKEWYGKSRWQDKDGNFIRAVTMDKDSELITRYEVQTTPPDLLITNYSMLEYMMLRPIERSIFDETAKWLQENPDEKLIMVIDEAHLYRGAQGTEVSFLIRRLSTRLNINIDRIQFILTSASFNKPENAKSFAADLTGSHIDSYTVIQGYKDEMKSPSEISDNDIDILSSIDVEKFYSLDNQNEKKEIIKPLIEHLGGKYENSLSETLYKSLKDFGPLHKLINKTMGNATSIDELKLEFGNNDKSILAITNLASLASYAKINDNSPGLFPARIHGFFRGLSGLWICLNNHCSEISDDEKNSIGGKLYSQPRNYCDCGSSVLELYTCRNCGTAYAKAYTSEEDSENILYLSREEGSNLSINNRYIQSNCPVDILLEKPDYTLNDKIDEANLNIKTLRIDDNTPKDNIEVCLKKYDPTETEIKKRRSFISCAVCGESQSFNRTSVMNHQTSGDQPFHVLVSNQLKVQPPNKNEKMDSIFSPNEGRKVLIFSDSRQTAARLAPNIQRYNNQDVIRSIMIYGLKELEKLAERKLSLKHLYLATLFGINKLNINISNNLQSKFLEGRDQLKYLNSYDEETLLDLTERLTTNNEFVPSSIYHAIYDVITSKYTGLQSLALATLNPDKKALVRILPNLKTLPDIAETEDEKKQFISIWLNYWLKGAKRKGFILNITPKEYHDDVVKRSKGNFAILKRIFFHNNKNAEKIFKNYWLNDLKYTFGIDSIGDEYFLNANTVNLNFTNEWKYCSKCKSAQPKYSIIDICIYCGSDNINDLDLVNKDINSDFHARMGYYRTIPENIIKNGNLKNIMTLVADEHTAQLNTQSEKTFSKAEENEFSFQDININFDNKKNYIATDILSSTTTMEVGIDIGKLTAVALRNMPPGRANYQQRAGRAGRRGNNIATVLGFAGADSHDEHYFSKPHLMISGDPQDPFLNLDNQKIAVRHILAMLLNEYYIEKLPTEAINTNPQLFEVLGTVSEFLNQDSILNKDDFLLWLKSNNKKISNKLENLLPAQLSKSRKYLVNDFEIYLKEMLDTALKAYQKKEVDDDTATLEVQEEEGEATNTKGINDEQLLNRLLYKGVLPRYAFPTDVCTFYVFDDNTDAYRPTFAYTPSQGLGVALSQYAPGKEVWIDKKEYKSRAIYSVDPNERSEMWDERRFFLECQHCHFSMTGGGKNARDDDLHLPKDLKRGDDIDCPACKTEKGMKFARNWIRPTGFVHSFHENPRTADSDLEETSYATPARLIMQSPPINQKEWSAINNNLKYIKDRRKLIITNRGPKESGYNYCRKCGYIEQYATSTQKTSHNVPFPVKEGEQVKCDTKLNQGIVLGTDFETDIALFSIKLNDPVKLKPGDNNTAIALKTICEAITHAASELISVENSEIVAQFRPSLDDNMRGSLGEAAEIFIYDTIAGGAGFSHKIADCGLELFERALKILKNCPNEECFSSCYRCLRSFKNKIDHKLLDRISAADLLENLIYNKKIEIDAKRKTLCKNILSDSLSNALNNKKYKVVLDKKVKFSNGITIVPLVVENIQDNTEYFISVESALTRSDYFADPILNEANDDDPRIIPPISDLIIRENIQFAISEILSSINE
jgi:ATP-dependent helicase YprA (DUF1998 family)